MSRQSKNAKNRARAKAITALHKNGEKGPARTTPLHGKRWGYRTNPDVARRIAELIAATAATDPKEKTSGKKILRGAGRAALDAE